MAKLPQINIDDLIKQRLFGQSTDALPQISELLQIPQAAQQSATPQVNPMDVYKSLGINVSEQGGQYNPTTLQGLQTGVDNKLNFGNQQLADMYKNPLFNAENVKQDLGQMKNYGNPYLANLENQQGFMPSQQPKLMSMPKQQTHVLDGQMVTPQATAQPQGGVMGTLGNIGNKALSFAGSPAGKSLIAGALVGALGGGGIGGLTAGLNTYGGIKKQEQANKFNEQLATQYGLDPGSLKGVSADQVKQLGEAQKFKSDQVTAKRTEIKDNLVIEGLKSENALKIIKLKNAPLQAKQEAAKALADSKKAIADLKAADINLKIKLGELGFQPTEQKLKINMADLAQKKFIAEQQKISQDRANELAKGTGKTLTAGLVNDITGLDDSIGLLDQFNTQLGTISDKNYFNPITGRLYTAAKVKMGDTEAKTYLSSITALKQLVGKAMEGGVLRAEDTKKYDAILGSAGATKAQLEGISKEIKNKLNLKRTNLIKNSGKAGYNVSEFDSGATATQPTKPTTTTQSKTTTIKKRAF